MRLEDLVALCPRLYHMAAAGALDSILAHGLLSTSALLDLFEVQGSERFAIEECHRPESVEIQNSRVGRAVIRDQKPMDDVGLGRALPDDLTPRDWYRTLNTKVFFWLTEERLQRMMSARAYRNIRKTVLVLNGERLIRDYADKIVLSPMNSGCTKPMPFPRGHSTFSSIDSYPFEGWVKKRRKKDSVVELAVEGRVLNIEQYLISAEEIGGEGEPERLWPRSNH